MGLAELTTPLVITHVKNMSGYTCKYIFIYKTADKL